MDLENSIFRIKIKKIRLYILYVLQKLDLKKKNLMDNSTKINVKAK